MLGVNKIKIEMSMINNKIECNFEKWRTKVKPKILITGKNNKAVS